MFMMQWNKKLILFYKSPIKSLRSLCITIVLRVYYEADLIKLNIPKSIYQLLKYKKFYKFYKI